MELKRNNFIKSVWKFSRPHTIIGSIISIGILFLLVFKFEEALHLKSLIFYFQTLVACLACNLFITGINQVYDRDIDALNKPNLPLITGDLTLNQGKIISYFGLSIALTLSFFLSFYFGCLIFTILLLGAAYSIPPIRFKRFHFWAAAAISLVRGPLVNLGVALHFIHFKEGQFIAEFWMLPLTVFMTCFSLGIAWFKDLPDTEGDLKYNIRTVAVRFSRKTAMYLGTTTVGVGYIFLIFWGILNYTNNDIYAQTNQVHLPSGLLYFIVFQFITFISFVIMALKTNISNQTSLKKFYKLYWILFFLEYFSFLLLN